MSHETARRARKREATMATITVTPTTGAWALSAPDGTEVARGEWITDGARKTIRVPLAYDASAYFDSLVDRRRAHLRAEALRAALESIHSGAKTIAEARASARAALTDEFEVCVRTEQADAAEGA